MVIPVGCCGALRMTRSSGRTCRHYAQFNRALRQREA
jgi:hypothetical protein